MILQDVIIRLIWQITSGNMVWIPILAFLRFHNLSDILPLMSNVTQITKISYILLALLITPLISPFLFPTAVFAQDVLGQLDGAAQTVAISINQARAQAGLPPMGLHPLLNAAAQNHVNDMVANYNYSHTGSDGSNVRQRVQRTGYGNAWASENWVSVNSPGEAIQWWMNSTVHRANILSGNWREYGIGVGRHPGNGQIIFVAVFAGGEGGDAGQIVMPPAPQPLPVPAGGSTYTIQTGDTLLSIGLRYGVEWPVIATANGLSEFSLLQIGQTIRLPGVDDVEAAAQTVAASAKQEEAVVRPGEEFVRRYTVQPGDTLVGIASIYGLSWEEVARENGLREFSVISVGTEIRIPGAVTRATPPVDETVPEPPKPETHKVENGETIISIAARYDIGWKELLELNKLSESTILALGQEIRIK